MSVWMINFNGSVSENYGWFDNEYDCEKKCEELNQYYEIEKFRPKLIKRATV